jgi:CheY-like chemotaxis protein
MQAGSPPPRSDLRVLIVDDSGQFRITARELLESRGYIVIGEAASASEALKEIDAHPPDAVLLDVRLGEESGAVVAAYLRTRYPAVSVLLVSADAPESLGHLDGEAFGAFGPVGKHELARIDLTQFWPAPPNPTTES